MNGPTLAKQNRLQQLAGTICDLKQGKQPVTIPDGPIELFLEVTKRCNLNCTMCSHRSEVKRHITKHGPRYFDCCPELIENIEPFLPSLVFLYTVGVGEPFLNRNLFHLLDRCRENQIFTWVNTNAQLIDASLARRIIESGLTRLVLSISGGSKETYEQYYRGAHWETFWRAFALLSREKRSIGQSLPQLYVNYLAMDRTVEALPSFVSQAVWYRPAGIWVKPLVNMLGHLNDNPDAPSPHVWDPADADTLSWGQRVGACVGFEFDPSGLEATNSVAPRQGTCLHPYTTLAITTTGDVYPCGQGECVGGKDLLLGNVRQTPLEEIWRGDRLAELRSRMRAGHYGDGCRECIAKALCRLDTDTYDHPAAFASAITIATTAGNSRTVAADQGNRLSLERQRAYYRHAHAFFARATHPLAPPLIICCGQEINASIVLDYCEGATPPPLQLDSLPVQFSHGTTTACVAPFLTMAIGNDGSMGPCQRLLHYTPSQGGSSSMVPSEFWASALLQELRQQHLSNSLNPTCKQCLENQTHLSADAVGQILASDGAAVFNAFDAAIRCNNGQTALTTLLDMSAQAGIMPTDLGHAAVFACDALKRIGEMLQNAAISLGDFSSESTEATRAANDLLTLVIMLKRISSNLLPWDQSLTKDIHRFALTTCESVGQWRNKLYSHITR